MESNHYYALRFTEEEMFWKFSGGLKKATPIHDHVPPHLIPPKLYEEGSLSPILKNGEIGK